MSSKILIAVVGPTAIGKTKLGIDLAKHFQTEIISADSRQFFKEMNIGTAVPSTEELNTVTHHFIQHKSISEPYSVGDFEKDAIELLDILFQKQDVVVMVGGSGLYVDAVVHGLDEFPKVDSKLRESLNQKFKEEGLSYLQEELRSRDLEYYNIVDIENPHRLIRALEVCIATNQPFSSFLNQKKKERTFNTLYIGIEADREVIYDRINLRVDLMMEADLLEEAKKLYPHRNLNALQTVGYRELFEYLEGNFTLDFAISEIKKNTRRFAKRQLTWLRKNQNILWVKHDENMDEILKKITHHLETDNNG
ncbi:tRNA (adenosine(37)-N6)-dimethylallyltransferase MiaA [Flagellimonas pacifica]|uniref:tRNA dimethylallyltransferase n=1 Tax=Flagellimonas pacifica TaxID=1247520 RepID=A0A285MU02_9FLAO|nr:tRNA (adenosine(37)-N6)-dimethylallyltransferase MiaA [Allomuricauda parva]SNZ00679.1 tRNA dimethylallyltransferase [Allomuricauda parva]